MKLKRSVLLTSLFTIILLVVALSTATFAWFSASSTVNVSVISFTASKGTEISDLAISWDTVPYGEGKRIDFVKQADMNPMIPLALPEINVTKYADFFGTGTGASRVSNFYSAIQTTKKDGITYYASKPAPETPSVCKSEAGDETFFLINKNEEFDMEITVSYTIEGDNGSALCVALFADGVLVGIMSNDVNLCYGEIVQGTPVASQSKAQNVVKESEKIKFTIKADSVTPMNLVAWYSGNILGNEGGEKEAILKTLEFQGDYVA